MSSLFYLFLIIAVGYLLGSINFFGIKFGNSAIILVGILFGHFGVVVPEFVGSLGLVLFLAAVGLKAGNSIVYYFKSKGIAFLIISLVVVAASGILLAIFYGVFNYPFDLLMGILSGAMTSTTSLASAQEAGAGELAAVGYGIAYIFGVIGVVLFVQIMPKIYKVEQKEETDKLVPPETSIPAESRKLEGLKSIDQTGLFTYTLTIVLGIMLGVVTVPLGNGITFNLGNSGGTLIIGLIIGHFKHVGRLNLQVRSSTMNVFSTFGISLFLAESGLTAGAGFVEILQEYGISLFIIGAIITLVTSFVGFALSYYAFNIPIYGSLGATTGAMTSAPSLGALIDSSGTDLVSPFYAATQPIATILLVFLPQVLLLFFGG